MDGLLGGLDRLIAKKRDLKQAAMQQLLTGQTRLPGFHGEWEVKRLERCSSRKGERRKNKNKFKLPSIKRTGISSQLLIKAKKAVVGFSE